VLPGALLALALLATGPDELKAALAAEEAGDLAQARAHLERAVKLSPNLGLAQVELAEVLLRSGEEGPALEHALREAQRLEPGNPRMWRMVGAWSESKQDAPSAITAYEKALALRADDEGTRVRLAVLYLGQHRLDDALAQYRQATVLDPHDHAARLGLADALVAKGDLQAAEEEFTRLVVEAPQSPLYQQRLQAVQVQRGEALPPKADANPRKLRPLKKSRY
jgi:predicted Zn-dependent protease